MRPLRLAPALTLILMLGPVLAGLAGTLLPAFGIFPALGGTQVSLSPFALLADWPGLPRAVALSLSTGLLATVLSLILTALIVGSWHGTRLFRWLETALSPLLAVPHAAAAFGIAFLIAPSGWVARLLSPWATGWERPPDLLIVQDPSGLAMTLGLVTKELPFLLLMTLAALPQTRPDPSRKLAQSLGYGPLTGWLKLIFPQVYAQIRLPVYAVLAYSMSVVDVALILGPNTPPPLAVHITRLMSDPDLAQRLPAAAGAALQLLLTLGALVLWRGAEIIAARLGRHWVAAGRRRHGDPLLRGLALSLGILSAAALFLGLGLLGLWSVAGFWGFPDALPDSLSLRPWQRHGASLIDPALDTLLIAATATVLAITLTLACLEAEHRFGLTPGARSLWLLYLPLLIPQIAFLPGLQTLALSTGASMGLAAVIAGHLTFVLPYCFLALSAPFRAWDTRFAAQAASLGASADRTFWGIRLPMLLGPVLAAAAIGFAVSVGQYLPTLLIGGGRVQTLTSEAVALASGGDRRLIGLTALAQTALVAIGFALAIATPRVLFANRKGVLDA